MADATEDFTARYRREGLSSSLVKRFRRIIYEHYHRHGRSFPWRLTFDPYHILVSEIMLQQTQTQRVLEKYEAFIGRFPDVLTVAGAPLHDILSLWQGLGYNRRALALKRTAERITRDFGGAIPRDADALRSLPGIGRATAAAILSFAYNQPAVLMETNVRSVFIHFFFLDEDGVSDAEIRPFVEKTLDMANPREWYYALMDYGVTLKKSSKNPGRRSAHYRRQSPFNGSNRQARGVILRTLVQKLEMAEAELLEALDLETERVRGNLRELQDEGLVKESEGKYSIA
ncbi:MAG: A/G-specific adenine glycosylase [Chloroflexota bacterium]